MACVLEVGNLTKIYKKGIGRESFVKAIDNISFNVNKGEVFGFLGPNGAGKTTTIKIIMGFIKQSQGSVKIFGKNNNDVHVKKRIGFLSENPHFHDFMTGEELLTFYGRLSGMSKLEIDSRVKSLENKLNLTVELRRKVKLLSKGMVQRLGLAQALIHNPDLIIFDEPTSGLDVIGRKEFRDIVFNLKEQGKTVFFSSHIISDIETLCDRVCIIHNGKIKDIVNMNEFKKNVKDMTLEDFFLDKIKG